MNNSKTLEKEKVIINKLKSDVAALNSTLKTLRDTHGDLRIEAGFLTNTNGMFAEVFVWKEISRDD